MNSEDTIKYIEELINNKLKIIDELIYILESTKDIQIRKKTVLALVDNFKDDRIVSTLIKLIKRPDLENQNAILVFALGEYSDCKEYIDFLVNLILDYDYHVAWNSYNILINMTPPFDREVLLKVYEKTLLTKNKIGNDKEKMIEGLIAFWDKYR
jgi:hypothetical protein